jgi:hypothetical protein
MLCAPLPALFRGAATGVIAAGGRGWRSRRRSRHASRPVPSVVIVRLVTLEVTGRVEEREQVA